MDTGMNTKSDTGRGLRARLAAWGLAFPGYALWPRLAAFVLLAWLFAQLDSVFLDMDEAPGARSEWVKLAGIGDGQMLGHAFALLVAGAVLWRIRRWRRAQAAPAPALHGGATDGASLSRQALTRLKADAGAAPAWLAAGRLLLRALFQLALLFFTVPSLALLLLYLVWLAWGAALDALRRDTWQQAARRAAREGAPPRVRRAYWLLPLQWLESLVLALLMWPARLAFGVLRDLGILWRCVQPALGDALILPFLWCAAFAVVAGIGLVLR